MTRRLSSSIDFHTYFLTRSHYGWKLLLLITIAISGLQANETIPDSLKANTGYYCYVRCLSQCVGQHGAAAFDTECYSKCAHLDDNDLCPKEDTNCWRTCKNFLQVSTTSLPPTPQNVTVSYVTTPQPSPWEADVRWVTSERAIFYLIQYVDTTDSFRTWATGGLGINVSTSNYWHFVKASLCPEYAFRVASVNEFGVSSFSEIVNLSRPTPVVPAALYSVRSAELLNTSFVDIALNHVESLYNTTVQLVINFAPPPNWELGVEITKVKATLHVLKCESSYSAFSPLIRQRPGESEFEVRLPGWIAEAKSGCFFLFTVDNLYTKCDPSNPTPYQGISKASSGDLPGFQLNLSCKNIRGSVCPYSAISLTPSCGVANIHYSHYARDNHTSLINTTVTFDRVLQPKDAPLLYYYVRYGEAEKPDQAYTVPFTLFNITRDIDYFKIDNDSNQFILPDLNVHKSYALQICAIYKDTPADNLTWNHYGFYGIDLSRQIPTENQYHESSNGGTTDSHLGTYVVAVAVPIILALIVAVAVFTFIMMKHRNNTKSIDELKVRPEGWGDDRYIIMPNRLDKWELDRKDVIIYEDQKLGAGAFGAVFKCKLVRPSGGRNSSSGAVLAENWTREESGEAAVKLLPEYADETAKSNFRQEINLMKNLGYHERLVNMLGCVTASEPLCLVVEFCQDGDLLHYLRDRRKYMITLEEQGIDLNNLTDKDQVNMDLVLCFKDLLSFSWQISVGLEYLSQKGFIHRDVAARNVLVDRNKKAKIGDFGLCRFSYDDSVYLSQGGRLPIKWMALEAIKDYEFTTKSDVWSYGVLLFEIITMGGNPYPGLPPTDLETYLEAEKRMEQPDNCPEVLYEMMLDCWQRYPEDRPTFTVLRERLRLLLEEITNDYSYMNLNQARDYYNVIPTDYPPIGFLPPQSMGAFQSQDSIGNGESSSIESQPSDTDARSDSVTTPNGMTPVGISHRDSVGSDQLLITPTTPKFKFFKFKSNPVMKSSLDVLHEGGTGSDATDGSHDGRSFTNAAYIQDLLPHPTVIYES